MSKKNNIQYKTNEELDHIPDTDWLQGHTKTTDSKPGSINTGIDHARSEAEESGNETMSNKFAPNVIGEQLVGGSTPDPEAHNDTENMRQQVKRPLKIDKREEQ